MFSESNLLTTVIKGDVPAFAMVCRADGDGQQHVDVLTGTFQRYDRIRDLPIDRSPSTGEYPKLLTLIPYSQIKERGFSVLDDGAKLLGMQISEQVKLPASVVIDAIPDAPSRLVNASFDPPEAEYIDLVRGIKEREIATGRGANFVIKRTFVARVEPFSRAVILAAFRRLLTSEIGAYWTFLICTGTHWYLGASPERHVSLKRGSVVMNPISGTYRYPPRGVTLEGVIEFLRDTKELNELYMVLDEELKMMSKICDSDIRIRGPYLRTMSSLAHTEYYIEGTSDRDARDILKDTMFAPTVVGSPIESACEVIKRNEARGRRYYSGVVAMIGVDDSSRHWLDSAILIRTAEVDPEGNVGIGVGATIVRDSDPQSEALETEAKASRMIAAFTGGLGSISNNADVLSSLNARNATISPFWREAAGCVKGSALGAISRKILIVDAEDDFTSMLAFKLRCMGHAVKIVGYSQTIELDGFDLVVMGPGPGDPTRDEDDKIACLRRWLEYLMTRRYPFLAICLSHQVLSRILGLAVVRRQHPNQGVQKIVEISGASAIVGFYNSFSALSRSSSLNLPGGEQVEIASDTDTEEVHFMAGSYFTSMQFHPESVLSRDGERILREEISRIFLRSNDD